MWTDAYASGLERRMLAAKNNNERRWYDVTHGREHQPRMLGLTAT